MKKDEQRKGKNKHLASYHVLLFLLPVMLLQSSWLHAQDVVFNETFDTPDAMARFTTIDVNNDGECWNYYTISENTRCTTGMNAHDDWLVTSGIDMKAGYTYTISFNAKALDGKLELGVANTPSDEALSNGILLPEKTLAGDYELVESTFTPPADGTYHIGFHAVSGGFWSYVDIDNITVTEAAPAQPETVLYGTIVTDDDNSFTAGIYSFVPGEQIELTPVATRTDYIANGGGVYLDGKYYFTLFMTGNPVRAVYNVYDFESGTTSSTMYEGMQYIASDMAYDPTTGNVYCCSIGETATEYVFSSMDLLTGVKTPIAPIEMMVAIAVDAKGQVYGISDGGILYAIDKNDARLTEIGDTGFRELGKMLQSATIDPATGEFWWAMANESESGLYKVDTATGEATLVGRFANGEHITGLFVRQPFFNAKAPAAVSSFETRFEGGSLEGTVSLNAPESDTEGQPLEGTISLKLLVDNKEYAIREDVSPGAAVEIPVSCGADGWHEFAVIPYNAEGNGQPANRRMYVGNDTPKAVSNVVCTNDGTRMTVTWTAPDGSVNGGYVDLEAVTYDIQRYPDYTWVATDVKGTTFTDELTSTDMCTYSYGIVAKYAGKESDMIVSNFVTIGDELALPIYETFEIPQTFDTWSIVDANNDGYTWSYSTSVRAAIYEWSVTEPTADDWLISPKFRLEAGKSYDIAVDAINSIPGEPEKIEVFIGTEPTAGSMTRSVISLTEVNDDTQWTTLKGTFDETQGGTYRIGIHVTSDTHIGDLLVRNISLKENTSSGITDVTGGSGLKAYADGGLLTVVNGTETTARIFTADGRQHGTVAQGAAQRFSLPAGMYIVTAGKATKKIMITR